MIRINLLPVRQNRKIEAARQDLLLSILGGVAVLGLVVGGWTLLSVQLSQKQSRNSAMKAEVEALQQDVAKVEEIEKLQKEFRQKLGVIEGLRARKQGPVHMLDDLATATPERLRLTSVQQTDTQLKISGISVNNEVTSQFLRALDASPYFGDVFLQDIEATPPDPDFGGELKAFKLSAKLTLPTAEAGKEGDKGGDKKAETGDKKPAEGAAGAAAPAPEGAAPAAEAPPAGGAP